ncbi:hypothetical protein B0H19DRAFT_235951 [Mycena capillaripes]|nr:hypothetical protein B0H19DRAFT_695633 [Mycena capillaripes]KAJ6589345.1 hypothetical protein B0H19DRAFT_235951 [Mycena capillaripes]
MAKGFGRDLFAAVNVGLSYGKGQTTPSWLRTDYDELANRLLANPHVGHIATFASAAFAMWAPRLYKYYHEQDTKLRQHLPHLHRPFAKSVFSCAAFNFGPNVWMFKHRDVSTFLVVGAQYRQRAPLTRQRAGIWSSGT